MKKLIRDKIPDIMAEAGKECEYKIADSDLEYKAYLYIKLTEECNELREAAMNNLQHGNARGQVLYELADVKTVLRYIMEANGISDEELDRAFSKKFRERGGFDKRIIGDFQIDK